MSKGRGCCRHGDGKSIGVSGGGRNGENRVELVQVAARELSRLGPQLFSWFKHAWEIAMMISHNVGTLARVVEDSLTLSGRLQNKNATRFLCARITVSANACLGAAGHFKSDPSASTISTRLLPLLKMSTISSRWSIPGLIAFR